ncbi:molecular chaperone HtpG [Antricoccus suffuscus]|uniref:Molecular chaperone HtpG n=1 Tax=Antricoccus suffuscus TaxID=1629062 RepID=A0A2T1A1P5_9ACTN|nr:HSP90 family protein [Antricoccus suffuscus]PRZ42454.1 molecular chaperone HtpG [Antricoccus suffuscus]
MREQFQVNLRGIVEILSHHLYSSPRVYLRELVQNARDAIVAREHLGDSFAPEIFIDVDEAAAIVTVTDNGVGLNAHEMRTLLATIGSSSKRTDFESARRDFLGQFGIGLLSCFLVADEIEVYSRSARDAGAETVKWTGYADGTFTVSTVDVGLEHAGSQVRLVLRPDEREWGTPKRVERLANDFAQHLEVPIVVRSGENSSLVSAKTPPWRMSPDDAVEYCRRTFGFLPLSVVPLTVEAAGVNGVAFITDSKGRLGDRAGDLVYSHGMLVSTRNDQLVPDWAFFLRAVIDAGDVGLTASRETLQESGVLTDVRARIGDQVRDHIGAMADESPAIFTRFRDVHATGLRAMAISNPEMLDFVCKHLPVQSTVGSLPIDDLIEKYQKISYVSRLQDYNALSALAAAQDIVLVNAGYVYEEDILRAVAESRPLVHIDRLDLRTVADSLPMAPEEDSEWAAQLTDLARQTLESIEVEVDVRAFRPGSVPAFYVPADDQAPKDDSGVWGDLMGDLDLSGPSGLAKLVLNVASPPVRALRAGIDPRVRRDSIIALHVLAVLLGGHKLVENESQLLSQSLTTLISAATQTERLDTRPHVEER